MKVTAILVTLAVTAGVYAEDPNCFNSGHKDKRDYLNHHSSRACKGYDGNYGPFQGQFLPEQTKSACVNRGSGHIKMEVKNSAKIARTMDVNYCANNMAAIANWCTDGTNSQGGYLNTGDWSFVLDPNSGHC